MTLKEMRLRIGLTQVQLAERLGVAARHIRRWENGEQAIRLGRLAPLARELNVTYEAVLMAIGEMESVDAPEVQV